MDPNHQHIEGLPLSIVSPVDLGRVMRELDVLDNQLHELQIRQPGVAVKMPKTSQMMDEVLGLNRLNLLLEQDRKTLKLFLSTIRKRAPQMHMSFSADPSPLFIERLMTWLRREIHPVVLLTVGLQPSIGAGCMVRTTNKYFDMSLAKDFESKRELLMTKIAEFSPKIAGGNEGVAGVSAVPQAVAASATPANVPVQGATA